MCYIMTKHGMGNLVEFQWS